MLMDIHSGTVLTIDYTQADVISLIQDQAKQIMWRQ